MYTIGIDVSKKELVSAKVTKRGEIIERWTIPNEPVAIAHWLDALPHALLGAEATAEYHNELARQCIARGVPFKLLNPIVTKQFTRATVRRRKTDRSDAEVIARCLLNGDGYLLSMESLSRAQTPQDGREDTEDRLHALAHGSSDALVRERSRYGTASSMCAIRQKSRTCNAETRSRDGRRNADEAPLEHSGDRQDALGHHLLRDR